MANLGNQLSEPLKQTDTFLKLVQDSFNVDSGKGSFDAIFADFWKLTDSPQFIHAATAGERGLADWLRSHATRVDIIRDGQMYDKFFVLGEELINGTVATTYKAIDDLINDVNLARGWLNNYKEFERQMIANSLWNYYKLTDEQLNQMLVRLGKSILGRALELCPYRTGALRRSGYFRVHAGLLEIGFSAPYASYVHDNMNISHPQHNGYNCGGRAKFLELAIQEFMPESASFVKITGFGEIKAFIRLSARMNSETLYYAKLFHYA